MKKNEQNYITDIYSKIERNGRVLPKNEEIENAILSGIIGSPDLADKCFEGLEGNPFYSERSRICYDLLKDIFLTGKYPSVIVVMEEIRKRELQNVISKEWVVELITITTIPYYIPQYISTLNELSKKRTLAVSFDRLVVECMIDEQPIDEIIDSADVEILKIRNGNTKKEPKSLKSLLHHIEYKKHPYGLNIGYDSMNECMRNGLGLYGGDYVIIGARPSVGKTTYAINVAVNLIKKEIPILFFSSEMKNESIIKKVFECISGIPSWKLNATKYPNLTMDGAEHRSIKYAREFIEDNECFFTDDSSGLTILDIRSRVARWKHLYGIKCIFIDYIQLLRPVGNHTNRESEIRSISQGIKEIAKEFDIVVFALSQLNRESGKRESKRPSVADLRDSGSLEQDADVILMPYDPLQVETGNPNEERDIGMIIAKNREGSCKTISFKFNTSVSRFKESDVNLDEVVEKLEESSGKKKTQKKPYVPDTTPVF